jgi:hypothetical protein
VADEPVSRMQPWHIADTQVIDLIQQRFVNDVSFGSVVKILATTLPQFSPRDYLSFQVFRFQIFYYTLPPSVGRAAL